MSDNPLTLSIVIPVYNEAQYLRSCLDAIAAQTTAPDEVIVVDNNSTDNSVEIAASYSFVTIMHEQRQGVIHARGRGFDAAKSDLIGRIDADTHLPEKWCRTVKELMKDEYYAAANGPVGYYDMPFPRKNYWIDHQVRQKLYLGAPEFPFLFGSNCVLRKAAWQKVHGKVCSQRHIHEDLDLAIHLKLAGLHILYDRCMLAGTSARRYEDGYKAFSRYMGMFVETYHHHKIGRVVPRIATSVYWFGYVLVRPWRLAYDDRTGKRSWRRLLHRHRARKNPMTR